MIVFIKKTASSSWVRVPGVGMESTCKRFKTWAPNSGRSVSGRSTGRVIYRKYKAQIKCPLITAAEFRLIRQLCDQDPEYFSVKIIEGDLNELELTMYAGDVDYGTEVVCGAGEVYYKDVQFSLIEE